MNPKKYIEEATHELRQVKWPTKNHAVKISIITGIFVIVSTVLVALVDFSVSKILFLGKGTSTESVATPPPISIGDMSATTSDGSPLQITTEGGSSSSPITITPDVEVLPETTNEPLSPAQ